MLARRLSDYLSVTVALLEAGDEEAIYPMIEVPFAAIDLLKTSIDWQYQTVPQNYSCQSLVNRVCVGICVFPYFFFFHYYFFIFFFFYIIRNFKVTHSFILMQKLQVNNFNSSIIMFAYCNILQYICEN